MGVSFELSQTVMTTGAPSPHSGVCRPGEYTGVLHRDGPDVILVRPELHVLRDANIGEEYDDSAIHTTPELLAATELHRSNPSSRPAGAHLEHSLLLRGIPHLNHSCFGASGNSNGVIEGATVGGEQVAESLAVDKGPDRPALHFHTGEFTLALGAAVFIGIHVYKRKCC